MGTLEAIVRFSKVLGDIFQAKVAQISIWSLAENITFHAKTDVVTFWWQLLGNFELPLIVTYGNIAWRLAC